MNAIPSSGKKFKQQRPALKSTSERQSKPRSGAEPEPIQKPAPAESKMHPLAPLPLKPDCEPPSLRNESSEPEQALAAESEDKRQSESKTKKRSKSRLKQQAEPKPKQRRKISTLVEDDPRFKRFVDWPLEEVWQAAQEGDVEAEVLIDLAAKDPFFSKKYFDSNSYIRKAYVSSVFRKREMVQAQILQNLEDVRLELLAEGSGSKLEELLVDQIINCQACLLRAELRAAKPDWLGKDEAIFSSCRDKAAARYNKALKTLSEVRLHHKKMQLLSTPKQ